MEEKKEIEKILDGLNPNQKLILLVAKELLNDVCANKYNADDVIDVWWEEYRPNLGSIKDIEILKVMSKKKVKILNYIKE